MGNKKSHQEEVIGIFIKYKDYYILSCLLVFMIFTFFIISLTITFTNPNFSSILF